MTQPAEVAIAEGVYQTGRRGDLGSGHLTELTVVGVSIEMNAVVDILEVDENTGAERALWTITAMQGMAQTAKLLTTLAPRGKTLRWIVRTIPPIDKKGHINVIAKIIRHPHFEPLVEEAAHKILEEEANAMKLVSQDAAIKLTYRYAADGPTPDADVVALAKAYNGIIEVLRNAHERTCAASESLDRARAIVSIKVPE